eukprot:GHVT01019076.1.p1 GENE.GHVT01019076.1~~GHVT01019076.1.p1  ORF type:complete len:226 (+),score=40.40 GHVT01019076.1:75-752(+)
MEDSQTCPASFFTCTSFSTCPQIISYSSCLSSSSLPVFYQNVLLPSFPPICGPNLFLYPGGEDACRLLRPNMIAPPSAPHGPDFNSPLLLWPADFCQRCLEHRLVRAPPVLQRPVPFENECSRLPIAAAGAIPQVLIQCQPHQAPPSIQQQALQRSTPAAVPPRVHQGFKAEAAGAVHGNNGQATGSVDPPLAAGVSVLPPPPRYPWKGFVGSASAQATAPGLVR